MTNDWANGAGGRVRSVETAVTTVEADCIAAPWRIGLRILAGNRYLSIAPLLHRAKTIGRAKAYDKSQVSQAHATAYDRSACPQMDAARSSNCIQ